jgi:cell division protein FtsB
MIQDYYRMRIMALEDANQELREREIKLVGFIFDLMDEDMPEDYKNVIREELLND